MAWHVRLKNEFTEDEKYHNLLRWLKKEKCENKVIYSMQLVDYYQSI